MPFKNNNQLINKSINLRMFNKRLAHTWQNNGESCKLYIFSVPFYHQQCTNLYSLLYKDVWTLLIFKTFQLNHEDTDIPLSNSLKKTMSLHFISTFDPYPKTICFKDAMVIFLWNFYLGIFRNPLFLFKTFLILSIIFNVLRFLIFTVWGFDWTQLMINFPN